MSLTVEDDKLLIDDVGPWAEKKYNLISYYIDTFATSMKDKWDNRVYIDFFSSCGYSRLNNDKILAGSPIIALNIKHPFNKYIFCEIDPEKKCVLETRIKRDYPPLDECIFEGDINNKIEEVIKSIPVPSKSNKVLCLSFVDPYNIQNLSFNTIECLAKSRYSDFMILLPTHMSVQRQFYKKYFRRNDISLESFLGRSNWRKKFELYIKSGRRSIASFVLEEFCNHMEEINFLKIELNDVILVKEPKKNLPLYHIVFFSKNKLGIDFWQRALRGTNAQRSLFDIGL